MKRKSIGLIIGLMAVALLGVMAMQLYFFRESYQLQSQLFDQSVHEALNKVVERIEKKDANDFLEKKAEEVRILTPKPAPRPILVQKPEVKKKKRRLSDSEYLLA